MLRWSQRTPALKCQVWSPARATSSRFGPEPRLVVGDSASQWRYRPAKHVSVLLLVLRTWIILQSCGLLRREVALLLALFAIIWQKLIFIIFCTYLYLFTNIFNLIYFINLQESVKNTSLLSLFYPLTLALSILILFFKKLAPFRLALYSFTNCLFIYKKN